MMLSAAPLERRLQTAAIILLLGLLVEVLCLLGKGPMAFMMFAGFCVLLFVAVSCCTCICCSLWPYTHETDRP